MNIVVNKSSVDRLATVTISQDVPEGADVATIGTELLLKAGNILTRRKARKVAARVPRIREVAIAAE